MKAFLTILVALLAAAVPVAAQMDHHHAETPADQKTSKPASASEDETSARVPELDAFHEVIFDLWHNAYPAQDTTKMLVLWPQIHEHIVAVNKAELPGILRDKKEAWQKGLDNLHVAELHYGAALSQHDKTALLGAAEELHTAFEGLVRTIRPVLPEIAHFHAVLYKIYNYDMPNKDALSLRSNLPALQAEMDTLSQAQLSERRAAQREPFEKARATLGERVKLVAASLEGGEWAMVEKAVEEMHTAYQDLERIFD